MMQALAMIGGLALIMGASCAIVSIVSLIEWKGEVDGRMDWQSEQIHSLLKRVHLLEAKANETKD
jgi:hypothetical protein